MKMGPVKAGTLAANKTVFTTWSFHDLATPSVFGTPVALDTPYGVIRIVRLNFLTTASQGASQ